MTQEQTNKPAMKFTAGAISATIWNNQKNINGQNVDIQSVNIQRSYKDAQGNWQSTQSFRENDIPKLQLVLSRSYEYMLMKEKEE